jgi:tetratricopeptide (TPR) repeat protein
MPSNTRRLAFAAALALALPLAACSSLPDFGPSASVNGAKIQTLPPSPEAEAYGHYLSAHLAASRHDLHDAASYYREALDHDPDNSDLLARAFLYAAASGDVDGAADLAKRVVAGNPDDRAARLARTVRDIGQGQYADARKELAQSGKGPFTSLTLVLLDAWAAQGLGDTQTALKDLKDVTNEGGTEALADFHSALILDLAGRDAEAEKAYQAALLASGPSPREVEAYGRFLERTGRIAQAKALYQKLKDQPGIQPVIAAGEARVAAGKTPTRLISTPQQGSAEGLFGIAASLTDASSADIAILYLRLGLYLAPDLDLAKIVLADRFEALEKYSDAIDVYRQVADDSPYKAAAQIQAAVDETKIDRSNEAISDLEAITKDHPGDITAWTALGDAYRSESKFKEAAAAYDKAVKTLPAITENDWPLFYARAVSEEQSKNWNAAEADLKHALKLSPNQPQVLNYLGYSWVDRGQHLPEALSLLEKARALSPFDGYIVDSVGWAYYRLGRYKDSADALQQAVQLVPGDPTINEHLGDAYWMVGRKLEARFQWDHALAFDPEPDQKVKLEEKLKYGLAAQGAH